MELQALYDLQERLEAAAAAGVRLAGEDFRLKRAVDSIAPLADASPVIKKLYLMAAQTIAPDCKDRAGTLLDTLALSEAILCTQAGCGVPGTLVPLELAVRPFSPCQPFRAVKPLLEALTGTGGGRYAVISEALQNTPELFDDYRVQAAMVPALSDRYNEIAALAEDWLSHQGESFLPLLKQGFAECSDGGRLRRLRVIEAISGEKENDFYISLLDWAKKDLREEAVSALRFDKRNSGLLLDLLKTEKGSSLEAARQVLVLMDTAESEQYLETLLDSTPWEAMKYLNFSRSDHLSARLGALAHTFFDELDLGSENKAKEHLELLLEALTGKADSSVLALYERAAAADWNKKSYYGRFPELLSRSIARSLDERLITCARTLAETHGKAWYPASLTADLLTMPAKTVYDQYRERFPKTSILGIGKEEKSRATTALMAVFGQINYVERSGRHEYFIPLREGGGRQRLIKLQRPLKENLDPRWFEFFTGSMVPVREGISCVAENGTPQKLDSDHLLAKMAAPEVRPLLGSHLYKKALIVSDNRFLYKLLLQCGWTDFKGLVARYVEKNGDSGINFWRIRQMIDLLPMTEEEKQQEFREIDNFICTYPMKSPIRKNWDSSSMMRKMIDEAAGII